MPFSALQISPCTPRTLRSFSLHATSFNRGAVHTKGEGTRGHVQLWRLWGRSAPDLLHREVSEGVQRLLVWRVIKWKMDLTHWGISRLLPALKRQIHEPLVNSIFSYQDLSTHTWRTGPKVLGWEGALYPNSQTTLSMSARRMTMKNYMWYERKPWILICSYQKIHPS